MEDSHRGLPWRTHTQTSSCFPVAVIPWLGDTVLYSLPLPPLGLLFCSVFILAISCKDTRQGSWEMAEQLRALRPEFKSPAPT